MSFLESIKGLFGADKPSAQSNTQSGTAEYVDWLPKYMIGTSASQITIDSQKPLPGAQQFSGTLPQTIAVINRLKILSGLSPVQYDAMKSGQFTKEMTNCSLTLQTSFTDQDGCSRCSLSLSIRAK